MMKKLALTLLVLIVLVGAGAYYLFLNLDSQIKAAVEKYGSAATQASVTLDSVKLKLADGQGTLSGLSIGNPKGFATPKAFYLGKIDVSVDIHSIKGNGPIVIKNVTIEQPQVTYELLNSGDSNLQAIQNNTQTYANSFGGSKSGGPNTQPAANSTPADPKPARKLVIEHLTINNGQVAISQEMLQGKQLSTTLPALHLNNIGKEDGGTTPAEVAKQVLTAITNAAAQASVTELAKEKINGVIDAVPTKAIGGAAADTINGAVKGLFGK